MCIWYLLTNYSPFVENMQKCLFYPPHKMLFLENWLVGRLNMVSSLLFIGVSLSVNYVHELCLISLLPLAFHIYGVEGELLVMCVANIFSQVIILLSYGVMLLLMLMFFILLYGHIKVLWKHLLIYLFIYILRKDCLHRCRI